MIKLWFLPAVVMAASDALTQGGDRIVWLAAVLGASFVVIKAVRALWLGVLKPFGQLITRALRAWDVIEDLPETLKEIRSGQTAHLAQLGDRLGAVEERVGAIESKLEPLSGISRELGVESRAH